MQDNYNVMILGPTDRVYSTFKYIPVQAQATILSHCFCVYMCCIVVALLL